MDIKEPEIVFLLGAGASIKAGVPDTISFVQKYQSSIPATEVDKKQAVDEIIRILKDWNQRKLRSWGNLLPVSSPDEVDVELLLKTLINIIHRDDEPLLEFVNDKGSTLTGYIDKEPIVDDLRDFIKTKAIVESIEAISYFDDLLGFIQEKKTLDIISLNYDTCIEQFSNVHKINYQDGFDLYWNPDSFKRDDVQIRLYKLHGSVIWYKTDRADYIKLPIKTNRASVELTTGEKAQSLMLYPMQKVDYAEPLLELLVMVKNLLRKCRFLIVVGYSFRDQDITRIIWDAARNNRQMVVILIDPKASKIYREKLKYFNDESGIPTTIPSSVDGKVVCLPYKFEDVFRQLRTTYLHNLRSGLDGFSTWESEERLGNQVNWVNCLNDLSVAEHTEKIMSILKDRPDLSTSLKKDRHSIEPYVGILTKILKSLLACSAEDPELIILVNQEIMELKNTLNSYLEPNIMLVLDQQRNTDNISIYLSIGFANLNIQNVREFLKEQYDYLDNLKETSDAYFPKFSFLRKVVEHLINLEKRPLPLEAFIHEAEQYSVETKTLKEVESILMEQLNSKQHTESSQALFKKELESTETKVIEAILMIA